MKFIAEFCQNHNGDLTLVEEMVHQAADAGASYAKIQTIFADDLIFREQFEEGKVENGITVVIRRPYQPEYDRLKKLELTFEQHAQFIAICEKYKIKPMTTCFTRGSVEKLAQFSWDTIKVASYDCGSVPLVKDLAVKFKHLIISTGSTFNEEINATAELLRTLKKDFTFLHCVTIYPTPLNELNLNRLKYLQKLAPHVGYSDHTLVARDGVKGAMAAIYMGAKYIERHFTILGVNETKDGPVSVLPRHVKELLAFSNLSRSFQKQYLKENVPEFASMLGTEIRPLSAPELLNRAYYRGRFATQKSAEVYYNWEDTS